MIKIVRIGEASYHCILEFKEKTLCHAHSKNQRIIFD